MPSRQTEQQKPLVARSYGLAVGAGNNTEAHAAGILLSLSGIQTTTNIIGGADIKIAQRKHLKVSNSTAASMEYTANSMQLRESASAKLFQLGLFARAFTELLSHPEAEFWLTPQNMFARQLVNAYNAQSLLQMRRTSTSIFTLCPDAYGKYTLSSLKAHPSEFESTHLTWNQQGYFFIHEELGLPAELIEPIDPVVALPPLSRAEFQEIKALPQTVLKVSGGSGGDPALINTIAAALWKNSGEQLMVYSGSKKTDAALKRTVDTGYTLQSSIPQELFYYHSRTFTDETLLLIQPSEMVKYLAVLASLPEPILPKVVLLPTRGEHEAMNIVAMIDWHNAHGIRPMICLQPEYRQILRDFFMKYRGFRENGHYQFVSPENLTKQHFQPTPHWRKPSSALTIGQAVRKHRGE